MWCLLESMLTLCGDLENQAQLLNFSEIEDPMRTGEDENGGQNWEHKYTSPIMYESVLAP